MNTLFALFVVAQAQSGFVLSGHTGEVLCLAVAPDGKYLASGGQDGDIRIWYLPGRSHSEIIFRSGGAATSLAYSLDGKNVAGGWEQARVRMMNARDFEHWKVLDGFHGPIRSVALSPDGESVYIIAEKDKLLYVWMPKSNSPVVKHEHESEVLAFALSPDGKKMATAVGSGTVRIFSVQPVQRLQTIQHSGVPASLAFSPDGSWLATAGAGGVRLWDAKTGKAVASFKAPACAATCLVFLRNGATLAVGTEGGPVLLLNGRTGALTERLSGHEKAVTALAVTLDGKTLTSSSRDKTVRLWEVR